MKKIFITFALVLALGATASAQKTETRLVADETTLTETAKSVKVVTSSEAVFHELITKYKSNFKRYTAVFKKDRNGDYTEYTIPFTLEQLPEVEEFLTNLK